MERVVQFHLEHLNELGDVCHKILIMELMGKHSNLIFCDDKGMILDSIKHVSSNMSSVREVLPGREYFIPKTQDKLDPLTITEEEFISKATSGGQSHLFIPYRDQSCYGSGSLLPCIY